MKEQQRFDEMARKLRVANLRAEVLKLTLSPKSGRFVLKRMLAAGMEARREASDIGRRIYEAKQAKIEKER